MLMHDKFFCYQMTRLYTPGTPVFQTFYTRLVQNKLHNLEGPVKSKKTREVKSKVNAKKVQNITH